jgi:hypothetical protein
LTESIKSEISCAIYVKRGKSLRPPHNLPYPLQSRKLFLYDEGGQFRIKFGRATENINVNLVQFRVRVGAEMALGQNQDARRPMGFKLVKGSAHDCEPAPFSDSIHNSLEVSSLRDPYTLDMSDEVFHIYF